MGDPLIRWVKAERDGRQAAPPKAAPTRIVSDTPCFSCGNKRKKLQDAIRERDQRDKSGVSEAL